MPLKSNTITFFLPVGLILLGLLIGNASSRLFADDSLQSTAPIGKMEVSCSTEPNPAYTHEGDTTLTFSSTDGTGSLTAPVYWGTSSRTFNAKWPRANWISDISEIYPRTLYTSTQIIEVVIPRGHKIIVRVDGGGEKPVHVVFPVTK